MSEAPVHVTFFEATELPSPGAMRTENVHVASETTPVGHASLIDAIPTCPARASSHFTAYMRMAVRRGIGMTRGAMVSLGMLRILRCAGLASVAVAQTASEGVVICSIVNSATGDYLADSLSAGRTFPGTNRRRRQIRLPVQRHLLGFLQRHVQRLHAGNAGFSICSRVEISGG